MGPVQLRNNKLKTTPAIMPPMETSSGMMRCSKSTKVATIKPLTMTKYGHKTGCSPIMPVKKKKVNPVNNSTNQ